VGFTFVVTVDTPLDDGTILTNSGFRVASDQTFAVGVPITIEVNSAPILNILKSDSPDPVDAGTVLTYTIVYFNSGNMAASGVWITDTFDSNVSFGGSNPAPSGGGGSVRSWDIGSLSPLSGNQTIIITVTVSSSVPDSTILTNTAFITCSEGVNSTTGPVTTTVWSTDLEISKTVTPTTLLPGDWLTYTLTFANQGHVTAKGVVITDIYQPISLTNVVSTSSGATVTPTAAAPPYTWEVQDLSYGQGGIISITAQVDPAQTWTWRTILTNTAYITTTQPDGNGNNDTDEVTSTIQTADVVVSKQIQPPTVVSNDTITYTLFYINAGAAVAQSVCLTDTLPAGVSYGGLVSGTPDWPPTPTHITGPPETVSWCTPTLASGLSGNIVITATVDFTDAVSAIFTNTVEITTTTPESNASNNIYQANNQLYQTADVTISKAVTPTMILHPDDMVTYTLTFSNQGYVVATGVVITDIYQPVSLTNVVSTSSGVMVTPTATTPPYTWDVQDLSYGQGGIITITARIDPGQPWPPTPTTLTNTALITTTATDGNVSNDSDQVTSTVLPGEPYTVTVAVSQQSSPICGNVLVTMTVTDQWNNPISGEMVDLTVLPLCAILTPFSVATTNGVATSTLTANKSCTTTVLAEATSNGQLGWSNPVTFGPDTIPTSISVTANPNTLPADGSSTSLVTAVVTDCTGPASGVVVTFTINPALGTFPVTPYTATTNASGIATGTLTAGTSTGTATITATADSLVTTTTVTFSGMGSISVAANPDTLQANGSDTSIVTVVVTDTPGSPASGVVVTFTISPALGSFPTTPYTATTNASGIATGTLTAGMSTGTAAVTATADSLVAMTLVTFTAVSRYGGVYLPIVVRNWDGTVPPSPTGDLIVTDIAFDPSPPNEGQPYHVIVTIQNTGTLPVTSDFWVDLYLNPDTSTGHPMPPATNDRWDQYCPGGSWDPGEGCYGAAWGVTTDLAPGATLDLHTSQSDEDYRDWPPPNYSSSHSPFYAQVDSWAPGFSYGAVYETDETNNIYCRTTGSGTCLSMSAVSSGVPSPGSRPSGSWEPRPTLPPQSEWIMTTIPTPAPALPTETPSPPTPTPMPSPTPVPTVTPLATPEPGETDTLNIALSPGPSPMVTTSPEAADTPTPAATPVPPTVPTDQEH
jgi:uncharacterized repeat protein (TIGR01451 family)